MNQRNISFEALRIIFILFMVLHHLDTFNDIDIPSFSVGLKSFCYEGAVGVNFFFMLSGLGCIIGYKERLERKQITGKEFLYNRLAKLYPAYLLFLFLAVLIYRQGHFGKLKQFGMHLFMTQTFPLTSLQGFGYNGVAWCISATMFFYLIFLVIYKINFKQCLTYLSFMFLFIVLNILYHNEDTSIMTPLFYTNPIFRLTDFLTGMAIGLYFKEHTPFHSWKLQLISILTFILFVTIGIIYNPPWVWKWSMYYLFPCAFLLFSFYGETKFSRAIFGHKFLLPLSASSMIIFLSHQEFWGLIKIYAPKSVATYFYEYFMPWGVLVGILCIVVLSLVMKKFFVDPTYRLLINLKKKFKNQTKPAV